MKETWTLKQVFETKCWLCEKDFQIHWMPDSWALGIIMEPFCWQRGGTVWVWMKKYTVRKMKYDALLKGEWVSKRLILNFIAIKFLFIAKQ